MFCRAEDKQTRTETPVWAAEIFSRETMGDRARSRNCVKHKRRYYVSDERSFSRCAHAEHKKNKVTNISFARQSCHSGERELKGHIS